MPGSCATPTTLGWRRFICFGHRGQRFLGCGLGPETQGVRIDAYGSTGDYLASGIDGLELHVHGNGQDQIGQILKSGKLVVYGDVGQTFMYGAKGGEVYVLGNAAGRPLINAAGRPRVVINGTALDFLAESFMAGDPYNGGGFVIVNGLTFDDEGRVVPQETPYPGSNLFSLASGGAIFVRDPEGILVDEQLNGGQFLPFGDAEWDLIRPYLEENERLFGITVDELLTVNGSRRKPQRGIPDDRGGKALRPRRGRGGGDWRSGTRKNSQGAAGLISRLSPVSSGAAHPHIRIVCCGAQPPRSRRNPSKFPPAAKRCLLTSPANLHIYLNLCFPILPLQNARCAIVLLTSNSFFSQYSRQ